MKNYGTMLGNGNGVFLPKLSFSPEKCGYINKAIISEFDT